MERDRHERRLPSDIFLLQDTDEFLARLRFLIREGDTLIPALAQHIARSSGPDGAPADESARMRCWIAEQAKVGEEDSDVTEVVADSLRDRYAELAACVDPIVGGGGELTLRSVGMLRAFITTSAELVAGPLSDQISFPDAELALDDISVLGIPLLGTRVAGHSPFRVVTRDMPTGGLSDECRHLVDTLLWAAKTQGDGGRHGFVVAPHLDAAADLLEEVSGLASIPPS